MTRNVNSDALNSLKTDYDTCGTPKKFKKFGQVVIGSDGRQYQLLDKKERSFSSLERFKRGCMGVALVICSFGIALINKQVRNLFTKKAESIFTQVLVDQSDFPVALKLDAIKSDPKNLKAFKELQSSSSGVGQAVMENDLTLTYSDIDYEKNWKIFLRAVENNEVQNNLDAFKFVPENLLGRLVEGAVISAKNEDEMFKMANIGYVYLSRRGQFDKITALVALVNGSNDPNRKDKFIKKILEDLLEFDKNEYYKLSFGLINEVFLSKNKEDIIESVFENLLYLKEFDKSISFVKSPVCAEFRFNFIKSSIEYLWTYHKREDVINLVNTLFNSDEKKDILSSLESWLTDKKKIKDIEHLRELASKFPPI